MTQAVVSVRSVVARTGFANPVALPIYVSTAAYIKVFADETQLTEGVDYILNGLGGVDGITVTIVGAEDTNNYIGVETFTVLYDPALDQQTDLSGGGRLGVLFEQGLDQLNRRLQALADKVKRSLKVKPNITGEIELPRRAASALVWDDDAEGFVALPVNLDDAGSIAALQGVPGADGAGVPAGGTSGSVLYKTSGTDFATGWRSIANLKTDLGISAFIQTLLDDADAAAARGTIGALGGGLGATDNALLRADGTLAATAQGSTVTLSDTGALAGLSTLSTSSTATIGGLLTTNGQVKFPATDNPSADANTLDDYEEGTWTPVLTATGCTFSYAEQAGTYTKVGNRVMVDMRIRLNTSGNTLLGNALTITGLPFANGLGYNLNAYLAWISTATSFVTMNVGFNNGASSLIVGGATAAATSGAAARNANDLSATAGTILFSTFHYKV